MKYLKLVNCPVRGLFPEKAKRQIDWEAVGLKAVDVIRLLAQGFDALTDGNYVSVFPIADEAKLLASGIIEAVNTNANEDDTASIITDIEADVVKTLLADVKAQQSA